jgi:hypothetical protein
MFETKVGDEVGYGRYHWGALLGHGFSRVAKINHHGHIILENGRAFDKYGRERKREHGGLGLFTAERLRAELREIEERRARARAASELKALIEGQRNGFGEQCPASDETRAKMIELVNQL